MAETFQKAWMSSVQVQVLAPKTRPGPASHRDAEAQERPKETGVEPTHEDRTRGLG